MKITTKLIGSRTAMDDAQREQAMKDFGSKVIVGQKNVVNGSWWFWYWLRLLVPW